MNSNQQLTNDQFISDLLDDCAAAEVVDEILSNEQDCETWYRYNLVSSVLKEEQSAYCHYEFTRSIAAQIADEPAIIARPKKPSNVIQFWKRAGGGFAVAASVAFAMVFSVQMLDTGKAPSSDFANSDSLQPSTSINDSAVANNSSIISAAEAEEQARLDEIQTILNSMGNNPNVYEQKVGGEVIYSTVIKSNPTDKQENLEALDNDKQPRLETSDN